MFDLSTIAPTRYSRPPRLLIYGTHKIGKTTFAADAPSPIFIPTEDGQDNVDAMTFPLARKWGDVMAAISALYAQNHDYRTVVLDSADWAEKLAQDQVCIEHQKKSIEEFGYGKGYVYTRDLFSEALSGLDALRDNGMQVIILAHSEIKNFDDPLSDSYSRYQIKLHRLSSKIIQEWADVIGFAQLDTLIKGGGEEKSRAIDTGGRVLRLAPSAICDSGNRYGLPEKIPLSYQAFESALADTYNK